MLKRSFQPSNVGLLKGASHRHVLHLNVDVGQNKGHHPLMGGGDHVRGAPGVVRQDGELLVQPAQLRPLKGLEIGAIL